MAVSLPLVALGYNKKKGVIITTLTGLVEPIGALLGLVAVSLFYPILPVVMGFAAGAMLFVISEEIIPKTQSKGKARYATFAVIGVCCHDAPGQYGKLKKVWIIGLN